MKKWGGVAIFGVLTLVGRWWMPVPAMAVVVPPSTLDRALLEADAVVFADVTFLATAKPGGVDVGLGQANVVFSRLPDDLQAIRLSFPVRLDQAQVAVHLSFDSETLVVGRRYLFFLSSSSERAPFLPVHKSVFPIADDGSVHCHSGFVYGLSTRGLLCDQPVRQVSSPMTEASLHGRLQRARASAAARRPEQLAEYEARMRRLYPPER